MREPNEELFLKDVAAHVMTVRLDQPPYRHVVFRKPETSNLWFELITWPNYLVITGDMGTWTFARVEDMFTFFRRGQDDRGLRINPHYWSEKLQNGASGGHHAAQHFDGQEFRRRLFEAVANNYGLSPSDVDRIEKSLAEVLRYTDSTGSEYEHYRLISEWSIKLPGARMFRLDPSDLPSGKVYTYHFLWCLYAIVWGIQQWDAAREGIDAARV